MSAELEAAFDGTEIILFAEGGGIYDVIADGRKVFSKFDEFRFPKQGEIADLLKS